MCAASVCGTGLLVLWATVPSMGACTACEGETYFVADGSMLSGSDALGGLTGARMGARVRAEGFARAAEAEGRAGAAGVSSQSSNWSSSSPQSERAPPLIRGCGSWRRSASRFSC
eukprot:scaffold187477_cov32-Tisochrysis_lutea.AAC.4